MNPTVHHITHNKENEFNFALSPRETEILLYIAKGFSKKEIATLLDLSINTVASYSKSVYRKLRINSKVEATLEAAQLGIINLPVHR